MTNFEKITASPEKLGEFLSSLPVADGPWDKKFQEEFCASCERKNCDGKRCPHKTERNNPTWWLNQAAEGEQEAVNDSEREFLIREYERRLALLKSGASPCGVIFRSGRLEMEPRMIVPLQDEDRHADGTCNAFNVYLNGKGPNGKVLRNIKKVIMPTVSTTESGQLDPMDMRLVFGGCEDAAEIVALLGKKCKLEVRAAVENWSQGGQIEFHGLSYILEAVPLQIETDTVKRRAGLGLTIGLLVYRYTATVGDTQLWDFEWGTQERQGDIHKTEKLFEEIKMKILELDVPLEEALKVLELVKVACVNTLKNQKPTQPQQEEGFKLTRVAGVDRDLLEKMIPVLAIISEPMQGKKKMRVAIDYDKAAEKVEFRYYNPIGEQDEQEYQ